MIYDRKEFFDTNELHQLHPELTVRDEELNQQKYVAFSNPSTKIANVGAPEWPVGLELWVTHKHERNVDGNIYDPLRFYDDRRGLTELLTGTVYGEIGTMTEVFVQHLFGGYSVDVMFGEYAEPPNVRRRFLVSSPYDVEQELKNNSEIVRHVLIRILSDTRKCAINSPVHESCNLAYHSIQYAADHFRRYEFLVYPLRDDLHSACANTISVRDYIHFYAAMYTSCIMLAHHNQARRNHTK